MVEAPIAGQFQYLDTKRHFRPKLSFYTSFLDQIVCEQLIIVVTFGAFTRLVQQVEYMKG